MQHQYKTPLKLEETSLFPTKALIGEMALPLHSPGYNSTQKVSNSCETALSISILLMIFLYPRITPPATCSVLPRQQMCMHTMDTPISGTLALIPCYTIVDGIQPQKLGIEVRVPLELNTAQ